MDATAFIITNYSRPLLGVAKVTFLRVARDSSQRPDAFPRTGHLAGQNCYRNIAALGDLLH